MGLFPDRWDVRGSYREVEEGREIRDGAFTEMF